MKMKIKKQHVVQLSNGARMIVEEDNDTVHIGLAELEFDPPAMEAWIVTITKDGILVMPNSCNAPAELVEGLRDVDSIRPIMGCTHYKVEKEGKTTLFNLDTCETCGGLVRGPNSIGGSTKDIPVYQKQGLIQWQDKLPPEIAYNENTNKTDCDKCHKD